MTLTSQTSAIRSRRITTRYPIGPVNDGREDATRYVEVATSHVADRKILTSRLTYIDVIDEGGGFKIEKWGTDYPYAFIGMEMIARYSDKALTAQHAAAVEAFETGNVDKAVGAVMLDQVREAQKGDAA
jgi:hypothetical protein